MLQTIRLGWKRLKFANILAYYATAIMFSNVTYWNPITVYGLGLGSQKDGTRKKNLNL